MDNCENCRRTEAKKGVPAKYKIKAVCGMCYREYQALNHAGREKYQRKERKQKQRYGRSAVPTRILNEQRRQRERDNHRADLVQPFDGGYINRDFTKLYPEKSREMFNARELNKVKYGFKGRADIPPDE